MKNPILIFESDDWGSLRLNDLFTVEKLKTQRIPTHTCGAGFFNEFDSLESSEDIKQLADVLNLHSNQYGSPKFTFLQLVANPDFAKIKASNFNEYFNHSIDVDYRKFGDEKYLENLKILVNKNIYSLEFHGREHLNVPVWMRYLKLNDEPTRKAFDLEYWGFDNSNMYKVFYNSAYDVEYYHDIPEYINILVDGLMRFKNLFGSEPTYFVPPTGGMNSEYLKPLAQNGIKLINSARIHLDSLGEGRKRKFFRIPGSKNINGQRYIKRNCFFEPSDNSRDWVNLCLSQIEHAFKYDQPAIVSTHRVNYVGRISKDNRQNGLDKLSQLLFEINKRWPDVNYCHTRDLYSYYENRKWTLNQLIGIVK
jgi:hypothetical protein